MQKMLRPAEASSYECLCLEIFSARHLDWRWEILETVMQQWLPLLPVLKKYWNPDILETTDSGLAALVSEALASSWHALMVTWLHSFTQAFGKETRWLEGCYCHQEILTEQPTRWKRKQRMIHLTCAAGCPWQGKRLPSFVVGHRRSMMQSLEMASSPEFRGAVLLASPHESARILDMDTLAKRSLEHALRDKLL